MLRKIKNYSIITLGSMIILVTLPDTNALNQTRTFEECVTESMGVLTLFLIFAPTEDLDASDIVDPAYKKTMINMCNFYHEKTGVWIDLMDEEDKRYTEQYGSEFYQKYGNTMPESLKQFAREQGRIE
jgi:hypothetical protein